MVRPNDVFETVATPVYVGLAIALLLSARELESWRNGRSRHARPHVAAKIRG